MWVNGWQLHGCCTQKPWDCFVQKAATAVGNSRTLRVDLVLAITCSTSASACSAGRLLRHPISCLSRLQQLQRLQAASPVTGGPAANAGCCCIAESASIAACACSKLSSGTLVTVLRCAAAATCCASEASLRRRPMS